MRLAGKVAIVTGGSRGIGEAIANAFAREGASVVIISRGNSRDAGKAVADAITASGGTAVYAEADVATDAVEIVDVALNKFGRLDVLCNNAAIAFLKTAEETSEEDWRRLMSVNLDGVFYCSKYALPALRAAGGGSIINIASVASFVGFKADTAYCTSKGGVLMLTRQMALDHAHENIRVNAICPGFIRTSQLEQYLNQLPNPAAERAVVEGYHPMERIGEPEEVAGAAVFLASDEASFVTGADLAVDGGLLVTP